MKSRVKIIIPKDRDATLLKYASMFNVIYVSFFYRKPFSEGTNIIKAPRNNTV